MLENSCTECFFSLYTIGIVWGFSSLFARRLRSLMGQISVSRGGGLYVSGALTLRIVSSAVAANELHILAPENSQAEGAGLFVECAMNLQLEVRCNAEGDCAV